MTAGLDPDKANVPGKVLVLSRGAGIWMIHGRSGTEPISQRHPVAGLETEL